MSSESLRHGVMSSLLCSIHIRTCIFQAIKTGDTCTRSKGLGTRQEGTTCLCKKAVRLLAMPIHIHIHITRKFNLVPRPSLRRGLVHTVCTYAIYSVIFSGKKNWGYYAHAQTVCTRSLLGRGGGGSGSGDKAKVNCQLKSLCCWIGLPC